jgi:EpsI family protein
MNAAAAIRIQPVLMFVCMALASLAAVELRPTVSMAAEHGFSLENAIPVQFGAWKMEPDVAQTVVNPELQSVVDSLYSQVLSRAYVDSDGQRIMLSIAYGEEQNDLKQVHRPDICYPAQGFQIQGIEAVRLVTAYGDIPARRMIASLGSRYEPLTYWTTVGERIVNSEHDRRLAQLRYGLHGKIPDGMIVRVSSIDRDADHAYALQAEFVADMVKSLDASYRSRIAFTGSP